MADEKYQRIAREIKDYLVDNGLTMTEVATRLGCSQQAVSNQLSGRKIGENVARKWAEANRRVIDFVLGKETAPRITAEDGTTKT